MKKAMKRLITVICVAAMLVGVLPATNLGQVKATDATATEEKTVFAETVTTGTITPGEGDTETYDGYVFGGYYNSYDEIKEPDEQFSSPLTTAREASVEEPVYIRWVPEEVMTVKAQVRQGEYEGYKRVISNCDSVGTEDSNLDNITGRKSNGTADADNKQEGEASLKHTRSQPSGALMNLYLTEKRDVRGYKYFSCKMKIDVTTLAINDANENGTTDDDACLYILLTSQGTSTTDYALKFELTKEKLETYKMDDNSGWYELKLPFAQAEHIASTGDTLYDGSKLDFVQIRVAAKASGDVTVWVDDICALNEEPGFVIADCDQEESFTSMINQKNSNSIIEEDSNTEVEEVKEGSGAIKGKCYTQSSSYRMMAQFGMNDANKLNISDYKTTGILHLWLYIADYENLNGKFTIQLSSSYGTDDGVDAKCVRYDIAKGSLQPGWNEILQPLKDYYIPSGKAEIEWTALNYVRVVTTAAVQEEDQVENAYMIVDDIRIIDTVQITDCDSADEIDAEKGKGHELSTTEDVMQGSNAFVQTDSTKATVHQLYFKEAIDFSDFKGNNGSLHFWFYIEDIDLWNPAEGKGLLVRLNDSSNDQDYRILKSELKEGWNELYINLDKPAVDASSFSWTAIKYLLLSCEGKGETVIKTMIDDISLVTGNKNTADVRFVSTVESLGYKSVGYDISQSFSADKSLNTNAKDVYETLYALGKNGKLDSVTPSGVSGLSCSKYMYTTTILNIPNRLWDAVFTITPYWVTQDGTKVTGEARKLTINYLNSVTKQGKAQTDFRVVITSDPHYTERYYSDTSRDYGYSADERMQLWVNTILDEHARQPIDLIIVNGDVSLDYWNSSKNSSYTGNETKTFVEQYVSQLREKEIPVIVLPGNHEPYSEENWYQMTGNSRTETYVLGNNLFIMPDSFGNNLEPSSHMSEGEYSEFDVEAIKKQMAEYPSHKVYIISHHIDMNKQDSAFLELLKSNNNIIGLFSGHTHTASTLSGNTYGGKVLAETGNFSYTDDDDKETHFWGFRDLVITEYHAHSRYITAECDPTINGEPVHYDRKEINEVWYY